jgi:hypothetical protein
VRLWRRGGQEGERGRPRGRTTGYPPSANRASSFHLRWGGLPARAVVVEVAATLEVVTAPVVPELYFWALQASFASATRPRVGAAHLGLQWYPPHPGSTAVNWGGYDEASGGILDGSDSALPSATGNPNTRDYPWAEGRRYRLTIGPGSAPGWWRGAVDGVAVRELHGGGDRLADPIVWAEVFARCDHPPATVRWSELTARTAAGEVVEPDRVTVTYHPTATGGCDNTTVAADGPGAFLQTTGTDRLVPADAVLPVR